MDPLVFVLKYNPMSSKQEYPQEKSDTVGTEQKLPEPNPVTKKRHNHDMVWQVYGPLTIGVVVVLLLMILTINGSNYAIRKGADASIIWLIAPALVISLIICLVVARSRRSMT